MMNDIEKLEKELCTMHEKYKQAMMKLEVVIAEKHCLETELMRYRTIMQTMEFVFGRKFPC